MISLAPWFYRSVLAPGGPIEKLDVFDFPGGGKQAAALLRSELRGPAQKHALYSDIDGCGTAGSKIVAIHKSVSEALERWAFYACIENPACWAQYGFDQCRSSTGMAAFPALTGAAARQSALHEAQERWSLSKWWQGELALRPSVVKVESLTAYEIVTPFVGTSVSLLHKAVEHHGSRFHVYGFAADRDLGAAVRRAQIELVRNEIVMRAHLAAKTSQGPISEPTGTQYEQRFLWFASEEGYGSFAARVQASLRLATDTSSPPELMVDCQIQGPWSRYAYVWRCLYKGQTEPMGLNDFIF